MNFCGILIGSEDPKRLADYYKRLFGEPGRIIWNLDAPDVRGEFDRLKAAGATVVVEPYTMEGAPEDSFIATFEDPDGNYFQIATPMAPDAM